MNIFFLSLFMFDLDVDVIGRYRTIGSHAFEQSLYSTLYIGYGIPNNLRNMAHTLQIPNDLWNAAHTLLLDFCVLNTEQPTERNTNHSPLVHCYINCRENKRTITK